MDIRLSGKKKSEVEKQGKKHLYLSIIPDKGKGYHSCWLVYIILAIQLHHISLATQLALLNALRQRGAPKNMVPLLSVVLEES